MRTNSSFLLTVRLGTTGFGALPEKFFSVDDDSFSGRTVFQNDFSDELAPVPELIPQISLLNSSKMKPSKTQKQKLWGELNRFWETWRELWEKQKVTVVEWTPALYEEGSHYEN